MSNNEADRLAEQIKQIAEDALTASAPQGYLISIRALIDDLAALAKQQAHEATAEPAAARLTEAGVPYPIPMDWLRKAFERANQDLSYGFKQSRAGNYKNPAISRDWKWFRTGVGAAQNYATPQKAEQQASPQAQGKYANVLTPFVAAMEAELHANSAKGDRPGWLTMSREVALLEIYWHAAKLSAAVKNNDKALIQEHSADVANMAMMLLDVCGGLDVQATPPSAPQAALPAGAQQSFDAWRAAAFGDRIDNGRDVALMFEAWKAAIAQATPTAQAEPMSDERIESMLSDLDQYAREVDIYDYGLPSICDHPRLVEIVREFLAARVVRWHRWLLVEPSSAGAVDSEQPQ
jgi:hypothetical protein